MPSNALFTGNCWIPPLEPLVGTCFAKVALNLSLPLPRNVPLITSHLDQIRLLHQLVKERLDSLQILCKYGVKQDPVTGEWKPDTEGCPVWVRLGSRAEHEETCSRSPASALTSSFADFLGRTARRASEDFVVLGSPGPSSDASSFEELTDGEEQPISSEPESEGESEAESYRAVDRECEYEKVHHATNIEDSVTEVATPLLSVSSYDERRYLALSAESSTSQHEVDLVLPSLALEPPAEEASLWATDSVAALPSSGSSGSLDSFVQLDAYPASPLDDVSSDSEGVASLDSSPASSSPLVEAAAAIFSYSELNDWQNFLATPAPPVPVGAVSAVADPSEVNSGAGKPSALPIMDLGLDLSYSSEEEEEEEEDSQSEQDEPSQCEQEPSSADERLFKVGWWIDVHTTDEEDHLSSSSSEDEEGSSPAGGDSDTSDGESTTTDNNNSDYDGIAKKVMDTIDDESDVPNDAEDYDDRNGCRDEDDEQDEEEDDDDEECDNSVGSGSNGSVSNSAGKISNNNNGGLFDDSSDSCSERDSDSEEGDDGERDYSSDDSNSSEDSGCLVRNTTKVRLPPVELQFELSLPSVPEHIPQPPSEEDEPPLKQVPLPLPLSLPVLPLPIPPPPLVDTWPTAAPSHAINVLPPVVDTLPPPPATNAGLLVEERVEVYSERLLSDSVTDESRVPSPTPVVALPPATSATTEMATSESVEVEVVVVPATVDVVPTAEFDLQAKGKARVKPAQHPHRASAPLPSLPPLMSCIHGCGFYGHTQVEVQRHEKAGCDKEPADARIQRLLTELAAKDDEIALLREALQLERTRNSQLDVQLKQLSRKDEREGSGSEGECINVEAPLLAYLRAELAEGLARAANEDAVEKKGIRGSSPFRSAENALNSVKNALEVAQLEVVHKLGDLATNLKHNIKQVVHNLHDKFAIESDVESDGDDDPASGNHSDSPNRRAGDTDSDAEAEQSESNSPPPSTAKGMTANSGETVRVSASRTTVDESV